MTRKQQSVGFKERNKAAQNLLLGSLIERDHDVTTEDRIKRPGMVYCFASRFSGAKSHSSPAPDARVPALHAVRSLHEIPLQLLRRQVFQLFMAIDTASGFFQHFGVDIDSATLSSVRARCPTCQPASSQCCTALRRSKAAVLHVANTRQNGDARDPRAEGNDAPHRMLLNIRGQRIDNAAIMAVLIRFQQVQVMTEIRQSQRNANDEPVGCKPCRVYGQPERSRLVDRSFYLSAENVRRKAPGARSIRNNKDVCPQGRDERIAPSQSLQDTTGAIQTGADSCRATSCSSR